MEAPVAAGGAPVSQSGRVMAAVIVTVVLLAAVQALEAAVVTLNSQHPDLLPSDCGRRLVTLADVSQPLIVGNGNVTAFHGQFPWQARIEVYKREARNYVHQCGGIIITQKHVITAAHCIDHIALRHIVVRVGDWQFGGHDIDEQEFGVSGFRVHSQFGQGTSFANDIALLRLRVRRGIGIEFGRFVQPACLPDADTIYEPHTVCEVSGWGKTSDGALVSEKLNGVSVPLVSDPFCSAPEVHENRFVHGQMFCAGLVSGGPDACGGDSGGPLVCRDPDSDRFVAYGIVSSGDPRGCGRLPGLYTKLSSFADWLLRRLRVDLEESAAARPTQPPSTAPREPSTHVTSPIFFPPSRPVFPAPPNLPAPPVRPSADMLSVPNSECGRSNFSPPEGVGAAFAQDAADFPWLVSLYVHGSFACVGAVIADRWILTAASCAQQPVAVANPDARSAVLNVDTDTPSVRVDIIRTELHPLYRPPQGSSYNMALMETSSTITLKEGVRPICLPGLQDTFEVTTGQTIVAAGWGSPDVFQGLPKKLKWAKMTVTDITKCRQDYADIGAGSAFFRAETFCTQADQLPAPFLCPFNIGDSGTPLMAEVTDNGVRRWYAAGLAVGGLPGCPSRLPDINVGLKQSTVWILSVISGK